jgi:hypothetical protein
MINTKKLGLVKSTSVAIGLVKKGGITPKLITGSGFFVNSKGYVMTADHVISECNRAIEYIRKEEKIETEIAVFHAHRLEQNLFFNVIHSVIEWKTAIKEVAKGYPGPRDLDIGVIIPRDVSDLPFLEMKNFERMQHVSLYHEICMCGYPSGEHSLDIAKAYGLRFSPVTQFGHITSFMPIDDIRAPWGLQTDIVGTGGSSGSAIVDLLDGKVVGIAQRVLPCGIGGIYKEIIPTEDGEIRKKDRVISGQAKIGLVYGITSHYLFGLAEDIRKCREAGIPIDIHQFKTSSMHFMERG